MRRVARFLLWPFVRLFRGFFDPRFAHLDARLGRIEAQLAVAMERVQSSTPAPTTQGASTEVAALEVIGALGDELARHNDRLGGP